MDSTIENENAQAVKDSLENILTLSNRKPTMIQTDDEKVCNQNLQ